MVSFSSVFGGQTVQPAQLSLRTLTLSANLTLQWPTEIAPGQSANIVAQNMYVTPSTSGLVITMPTALTVSNGEEVLWTNPGTEGFAVVDSNGGSLISQVSGGTSRLLVLRDNATSAGTWFSVALGATASSVNAAALAGLGLTVITTTLNQSHPVSLLSANFQISANDRAQVLVWNGGAGNATPPAPSALGNNWFTVLANQGTGTLTVSGGATIDGATNLSLANGDSAFLGTNGTVYFTFGKSLTATSNITAVSVSLAPGGTTVLSSAQLASRVQTFTGTLSAAAIVEYGTTPGFWLISNTTTGAYSTTFRVNSSDAGVTVNQGNYAVLRDDGTNIAIAQTATNFAAGNVSAPGLYVTSETSTGFFQVSAVGGVSIGVNATERLRVTSGSVHIFASAFVRGALNVSGSMAIDGDLTVRNGSLAVSGAPTTVSTITGRTYLLTSDVDQPVLRIESTGTAWATAAVSRITTATAAASAWAFLDCFSSGGDKEFRMTGDGWGHADGGWVGGGADVAEFWETMDGKDIKPGLTVVMDKATFKVRVAVAGEEPFGAVRPKKGGGVSFIMNAGSMNWTGKFVRDPYGAIKKGPQGERVLSRDFDPNREYLPRNRRPEWVLVGIKGRVPIDDAAPKAATWLEGPPVAPGFNVRWWLIR